jgi:hypothetical protein
MNKIIISTSISKGNPNNSIKNGIYSIIAFLTFLTIEKLTSLIPDTHALGTLNLIANFFDNSAHGTTVVGAFNVSFTVINTKFIFIT